jgi:type II secretory pathway predicted ATPase ExeA
MRWILLAFDLDYRGKDKIEMYEELVNYLIEMFNRGRPVTLIIDEAQHLGADNLEQLRMLSNVNTEKGLILQTILVGQPELWDLLRRPELQQFTQRISYDYYLAPLDDAETTRSYIQYRLGFGGATDEIFEEETYEKIFTCTQGIPRLINLICDTALVYGFAEEHRSIGIDIVEQVIADKAISVTMMMPEDNHPELHGKPGAPKKRKMSKQSTIERAVLQRKSSS